MEIPDSIETVVPIELGGKIRGVLYFLGALLAKMGKATIPLPGRCDIGERGYKLHIDAMRQMGANVKVTSSGIEASCDTLRGKHIVLPFPSRGVTGNIMLAATGAIGDTIIENANTSPEIINLGKFLINMGVEIEGIGTNKIIVHECSKQLSLLKKEIVIPPDKIEVATMLMAGIITHGQITVKDVVLDDLSDFIDYLYRMNINVSVDKNNITAKWSEDIRGTSVIIGFPPAIDPDFEPIIASLLCTLEGKHRIHDSINPERHLRFLPELTKLGACIEILDNTTADIIGVPKLNGSMDLQGKDIRGAVSLVLAALSTKEPSIVYGIEQIDRGYEKLEVKLRQIGAKIQRINIKELEERDGDWKSFI